jgi:hypothetical protein
MKKAALFSVMVLLLTLVSCNMEKRLYRHGWYKEHSHTLSRTENKFVTPAPEIKLQSADTATADPAIAIHTSADTIILAAVPDSAETTPLKEWRKKLDDSPIFGKKMSYAEAMASMAKKGCTPNKFAKTIYLLSILSLVLCWLSGIGILLALITLALSIFAIDSVLAGGTCVEENLAIIHAAQRNCWLLLLIVAILTILLISFVLILLPYLNGY